MAVTVERLEREFILDDKTVLPDPGPHLSVEQVREIFMHARPEITTATVVGPETVNGKLRYSFHRVIGAKG